VDTFYGTGARVRDITYVSKINSNIPSKYPILTFRKWIFKAINTAAKYLYLALISRLELKGKTRKVKAIWIYWSKR